MIADADVVVTHASNDVGQMRSSGLGVPRRFKLIPLGWHPVLPADRDEARLALGARKGEVVALVLGFIRSDKGLDLVADAAAALDPDIRGFSRLWLPGKTRADSLHSLKAFGSMDSRMRSKYARVTRRLLR